MGKVKYAILIVVMLGLIGGWYFYLSNYKYTDDKTVITAVQNVLLKNLDTDYPPTPREVIKYYSDVVKCAYNETYTDEQLEQMAEKLLTLYDEELAENNPKDVYIDDLVQDVKEFVNSGYSIVSYTVSSSTDVKEYTYEGRQCASLYCTYSVKKGADYVSSQQLYVLRKETETGHWKILGFDIITPEG